MKQVDFDGTHSYSQIVPVYIEYRTALHLAPNPSDGNFVIVGEDIENSTITMTSMLGQEAAFSIVANTNEASVQTSKLDKGVYIVTIRRNGVTEKRKMVVN